MIIVTCCAGKEMHEDDILPFSFFLIRLSNRYLCYFNFHSHYLCYSVLFFSFFSFLTVAYKTFIIVSHARFIKPMDFISVCSVGIQHRLQLQLLLHLYFILSLIFRYIFGCAIATTDVLISCTRCTKILCYKKLTLKDLCIHIPRIKMTVHFVKNNG